MRQRVHGRTAHGNPYLGSRCVSRRRGVVAVEGSGSAWSSRCAPANIPARPDSTRAPMDRAGRPSSAAEVEVLAKAISSAPREAGRRRGLEALAEMPSAQPAAEWKRAALAEAVPTSQPEAGPSCHRAALAEAVSTSQPEAGPSCHRAALAEAVSTSQPEAGPS